MYTRLPDHVLSDYYIFGNVFIMSSPRNDNVFSDVGVLMIYSIIISKPHVYQSMLKLNLCLFVINNK